MKEKKIENLFDLGLDEKRANKLETDIKAEVVAASLIEQGVNPDVIKIIRDKAFQRNWNKDIDSIEIQYNQSLLRDHLIIKTNRSGIYDILPENIFHRSGSKKFVKDKEDAIDEIRQQRKEEFYARKFFQLFESVLDDSSIQSYLYEAKFDKKISNSNFINIFASYWPILQLLEKSQAVVFLHTIPLLHKIRTQLKDIEEAMSLIMNVNIKIEKTCQLRKEANNITKGLGKTKLGVDWIVGETFNDGLIDLKLKVGPIPAYQMINYIETSSKGFIILDYLCNLFFSADTIVEKEFIVSPEDANFYLSDDNHITHLGINTFL